MGEQLPSQPAELGVVAQGVVALTVGGALSLCTFMLLHSLKASGHLDSPWLLIMSPLMLFSVCVLACVVALPLIVHSSKRPPFAKCASVGLSALAMLFISAQLGSSAPPTRWSWALSPVGALLCLHGVLTLSYARGVAARFGLSAAFVLAAPLLLRSNALVKCQGTPLETL